MLVIFFAKLDEVISKQYQKIFEVSCHNQKIIIGDISEECVWAIGHWFSLPLYVYTLWANVDTVILHLSCNGIYIYPSHSHIMIMSPI